jgi:hypothetical protein
MTPRDMERLGRLDACAISDALDQLGLRRGSPMCSTLPSESPRARHA